MRVWRVSPDKKHVERVGILGKLDLGEADGPTEEKNVREGDVTEQAVRGVINDIEVFERGEKGKDGVCVVVATGTEHRLGRWKTVKGKNGAVVFEVPRIRLENGTVSTKESGDVGVIEEIQ